LCVEVAGSLLRRTVATEAGILFVGHPYSSRGDRSSEHDRTIIPASRAIGCAEESDGTLAGFLDRDRLGCVRRPIQRNTTSSRLPAHALSRPLSTIDGHWACFAVNCVLSSDSRSFSVGSSDAEIARRVKQLRTKISTLARQSQQPSRNCGDASDYHRCWTSTSYATMVLNIAHCRRRYFLHPSS
jgi:hypothetical protein